MDWWLTRDGDPRAKALADRHYSRQNPDSALFVGPGVKLVLLTGCGRALWATRVQAPEYVQHAWPEAWECVIFRNEGAGLSSDLIRQAVAASRAVLGEPPRLGMVTFVKEAAVRRKRDPGRCFLRAGFRLQSARTKVNGHLVFLLPPEEMPEPVHPCVAQSELL